MNDEELIAALKWEPCNIERSFCLVHDSVCAPGRPRCERMMDDLACAEAGIELAKRGIAEALLATSARRPAPIQRQAAAIAREWQP